MLQDCMLKIGNELDVDIPSLIETEANPSLLYPMLEEEDVLFSDWYPWIRSHIFDALKSYGYNSYESYANINNGQGNILHL